MGLLKMIGLMTVAEHEQVKNEEILRYTRLNDSLRNERNEAQDKFKRAATDLAAQAEEVAVLSEAFPANVRAVMDAMSDCTAFTAERTAADATFESGIMITPAHVTAIRKALHTLGLAGFGVLRDEDSERVMGRGYWLTSAGVDVRRVARDRQERERQRGERRKGKA